MKAVRRPASAAAWRSDECAATINVCAGLQSKAAAAPGSFFNQGTKVSVEARPSPVVDTRPEAEAVSTTGAEAGGAPSDVPPPPDPTPGPFGPPADDDGEALVELATEDLRLDL